MFAVGLVAASYFGAAQIGLLIPSVGPMVCVIWPPAGIALAALFRFGIRLWPGVFLGAFVTNLGLCGPAAALGVAAGATLAAVGAAWMLKRRRFNREFQSVADLKILVSTALLASAVAALAGTASLLALGTLRIELVGRTILNWWLGDSGGIMIVAPFLLAASRGEIRKSVRAGHLRGILGSFGLLLAACAVLYAGIVPPGRWGVPGTFVLMILIARTASLYRTWPATLQILIVGACVVWNNYNLSGPSLYLEPTIRIYAAWAFLVTGSFVALGISGLLAERDTIERKIKTGEQTYRALVHDNPALICRFSTDGQLLFANETFRRTFELPAVSDSSSRSRSDFRLGSSNLNFFEITGLSRDARTRAELQNLDAPERPVYFDTCDLEGSNSARWYRWTARAVDISSTVVIEFHAVGLDVTDQKKAESERKALEAQAIQTQQYEAIGVLAGGIAHEFNNLLTGLLGNADLALMMLPKGNAARPMLGEVLRAAQRAAELTKQLSIYAGQTDTHPARHSIPHLLASCERLIEVVVPKNSTVRQEAAAGDLYAVVDETKFRQLFLSLVTNAAESLAGRGGAGEIVVRTSRRSIDTEGAVRDWVNGAAITTGDHVLLEVSDTGCGMSAATLDRIFEPFFTTKFAGRGLGMAAVLGIVQDHAGAIQVKSRENAGTKVRVLLPIGNSSIDLPTPVPRSVRRSGTLPISITSRP